MNILDVGKGSHVATSVTSQLLTKAQQRFKEVQQKMVLRFSDGNSEITLVVWDFGGQEVRSTNSNRVVRIPILRWCMAMQFL